MPPAAMITRHQALAVRRLLLVAAALAGTLLAHAICAHGVSASPVAPLGWASVALVAVVAGPRAGGAWRAWSPGGLLARLLVAELALHGVLTAAPWALGLTVQHQPGFAGPSMLAAHGAVAVVLWFLLAGAQGLLDAMVRLAGRVRRALRRRRSAAPRLRARRPGAPLPVRGHVGLPRGARGPPVRTSP